MPRYRVADHRRVWKQILPGLEELHAQHPNQDWSVEGLLALLDKNRVLLVIDVLDPTAFAIVKLDQSPYRTDGELELFVLVMRQKGGGAIGRIQPHLEAMARVGGAKSIRFFSRRPGMLRLAPTVGYCRHSVEYVKEI